MSVGTSTALIAAGVIGAAGAAGGSLISSSAAKSAANTQKQAADESVQLQRDEFNKTQANQAPWLEAGKISLAQLMQGLQPGGQFATPYSGTFKPPTLEEAQNTPGYQFAQKAGEQGILHGASAAGGAFTTGTLSNLAGFNNNLAQNAYQQTYTNALNTFDTQFNTYNTNQANLYNRLAASSGLGQTTGTQLGQLGQESTNSLTNLLTSGAAAQAAGTVGQANALSTGIAGATNNFAGGLTLQQLLKNNTTPNPTLPGPVSYQQPEPTNVQPASYDPYI